MSAKIATSFALAAVMALFSLNADTKIGELLPAFLCGLNLFIALTEMK